MHGECKIRTILVAPVPIKGAPPCIFGGVSDANVFSPFKETGRQRKNFRNLEVLGEKRLRGVGHALHGVCRAVLPDAVAHRHGSALFRVRQVSVRRAPV